MGSIRAKRLGFMRSGVDALVCNIIAIWNAMIREVCWRFWDLVIPRSSLHGAWEMFGQAYAIVPTEMFLRNIFK